MRKIGFLLSVLLVSMLLQTEAMLAAAPDTLWTATYGGTNIDVIADILPLPEGGFVATGYTRSYGTAAGRNLWLLRADSAGTLQWSYGYGVNDDEEGFAVQPTADGGFLAAGYTKSLGNGKKDVFLVKTDQDGNQLWLKTFGGSEDDECYSMIRCADGGYLLGGVTSSMGNGSRDGYLIKLDSLGNFLWEKTLGGMSSDGIMDIIQTGDGGFAFTGWTFSEGPGFLGNAWLGKTDSTGQLQFSKAFGGSDVDRGNSLLQLSDGGFLLTGYTDSYGAGNYDVLLIRTDASGNQEWLKTFGGSGRDYGNAILPMPQGGFLIAGYTLSFGAGGDDVFLVGTDAAGNWQWQQTYGGSASDVANTAAPAGMAGFWIAGHTLSSGAGLHDGYVIRLGTVSMPVFQPQADSLYLGSVTAGDTLQGTLTIANPGEAALHISHIFIDTPGFSVLPDSATIAPDSAFNFSVTFATDSSSGRRSANLIFTHNAPSSPDTVVVIADVLTALAHRKVVIPESLQLLGNYPNPFNPQTVIAFRLHKAARCRLTIMDALGRVVNSYDLGKQTPGLHRITWNGKDHNNRNVGSGLYLYRLEADGFFRSGKMLLLK
ncbi:MAG: hypothetical protein Kow0037_31250 [Calditrichia bacterium]